MFFRVADSSSIHKLLCPDSRLFKTVGYTCKFESLYPSIKTENGLLFILWSKTSPQTKPFAHAERDGSRSCWLTGFGETVTGLASRQWINQTTQDNTRSYNRTEFNEKRPLKSNGPRILNSYSTEVKWTDQNGKWPCAKINCLISFRTWKLCSDQQGTWHRWIHEKKLNMSILGITDTKRKGSGMKQIDANDVLA